MATKSPKLLLITHGMNYKLISESDGQAIESTLTANGAHKEEPDGVFENEAENLVFFDKVQGLWKCRICSWTYQNRSVCLDHIQNHNGQFHKPMHDKILNFETEGVGHGKMEVSSESYKASEEIESADIDLIDEETEYDVETVLQKQNTHDLYCPNCNSCITGRVILRKRKRNKIQISVKRTKTEKPTAQESDDQVHPHHMIGAEEDRDSGPDLFRCLSCFSFFMPTGNGFKFWKFGDKSRKENVRDEQVPRKKSWFPSIFAPHNQDTAIEQDIPPASEPLLGTVENDDTLECEDKILLSPRHEHSTNGLAVIYGSGNELQKITEKIDAKMEQPEIVAGYHLKEPMISNDQFEVVSGYYLKEPIIRKEPLAVFSGYHLKEPIRGDEEVGVVAGYHLKEPVISKDFQVTHGSDLSVTTLTVDETEIVNEEPAQDAIFVSRKGGSNLVIFSNDGSTTIEKSEEGQILIQTAQKGSTGEDTVITIDSYPATEIIPGIVIPAETTIPTQPTTQNGIPAEERMEDVRRNSKIEVIKSIVYGGLAELITSLSVVSSAAGGDVTTLNILALGMANLIGGFFVICHNLWELRCEQTDQVNSQSDRYQELLGQRQNFKLHAIVCVLSYLIFGLTPIVVYGFSFRQSEESELKLVVVGAVSLVCIIALSIGKAYVCRPPKAYVKTVVNFVILGFMASGISYAAGVLVKRFLERLGLFQSTSVSDMIFNRDSTWASY
ncbi:membrane protein of ER body-like protein isoform X2 [Primulina tabacum]|uniref:membrane protein of ER body-like protein isoform X2 n=1 Tax=Primulina tabacum TaxID=48773 RepID=UPI003F5A690A